jgi:hypothetical protein
MPAVKIIFVSQESCVDVVAEAFDIGARGYVVKARAGRDLLAAVEAVLADGQFCQSRLDCRRAKLDRNTDFLTIFHFCSAVLRLYWCRSPCKCRQLPLRSGKFCKAAVHADKKFREYKDARLFKTSNPSKCTLISALNFRPLSELHDLHFMASLL